jgi:hypothetical protein
MSFGGIDHGLENPSEFDEGASSQIAFGKTEPLDI